MAHETLSIEREIRQNKPFPTERQKALVALMRTNDEVRRFLSSLVEPAGVTLQQYNVLRILRGAGDDPLPTLEIADRMLERTPGVTRLLDRLVNRGWVDRVRCPEDRRRVLCSITESGLELLAGLDDVVDRGDAEALGGLSDDEMAALTRMLDRLRAHVRSAETA